MVIDVLQEFGAHITLLCVELKQITKAVERSKNGKHGHDNIVMIRPLAPATTLRQMSWFDWCIT